MTEETTVVTEEKEDREEHGYIARCGIFHDDMTKEEELYVPGGSRCIIFPYADDHSTVEEIGIYTADLTSDVYAVYIYTDEIYPME